VGGGGTLIGWGEVGLGESWIFCEVEDEGVSSSGSNIETDVEKEPKIVSI